MSDIDADLVSAAAKGEKFLHAEIFRKMASLNLDEDDIQAVMDALCDAEQIAHAKFAAGGLIPYGPPAATTSPKVMQSLALAAMLAGPAIAGVKYLMGQGSKDRGWNSIQSTQPDLVAADPVRARAIYDLIHSSSPQLAENPVVAGDLVRQMMSLPQIDVGTAGAMARMGKDMHRPTEKDGPLRSLSDLGGQMTGLHYLTSGTAAPAAPKLAARHIAEDGTPCIIDWSTEAMKQAGITDAFMGSGTPIEQADKATAMNQMQQQSPLLPLDNVVKELLQKEMELAQREEILAQQEMQMQESLMALQQMGQGYGDQFGVDPATGMAMGEEEMLPEDQMVGPEEDPTVGDPMLDAPPADAAGFPPEMGAPEPPPGGEMMEEELPPEAMMEEELPPEGMGGELPPEAMMEEELPPEAMEGELPPEAMMEELPPEAMMEEELPPEGMEGELPPEAMEGELPPEGMEGELPPEGMEGELPPEAMEGAPVGPFMGGMPESINLTVPLPSLQITIKTAAEMAQDSDVTADAVAEARATMLDQFILPNN